MKPPQAAAGCMKMGCCLEKMRSIGSTDPATCDDPDGRTFQTSSVQNAQTNTLSEASDATLERARRRSPTRCARGEDSLGAAFTGDSNGGFEVLVEIKRTMQGDGQAQSTRMAGQVPHRLFVQVIQMIDESQNDSMGSRLRRGLDVGSRLGDSFRGDEEVRGTSWPDERDHFHGGFRDDSNDLTQTLA